MGKVKELSMLIDELHKCGEILIGISRELTVLFSSSEVGNKKPAKKKIVEVPEEKVLTLEDVRAVCADKSRSGFTADVKAILNKHGVEKLSEINPTEYKTLLAEVEVLGNAG